MTDPGSGISGSAVRPGRCAGRVVVFYDGACGFCRREIGHYRKRERRGRIEWVDISRFPERLAVHAIDYSAAIRRLHVVDMDGSIRTGVQAFVCVWSQLPVYCGLAWLVRVLRLQGVMERLYTPLTRWRLRNRCDLNRPPVQAEPARVDR